MLFHWLSIWIPLTPTDAQDALCAQTATSASPFGETTARRFKGRIDNGRFKIARCIDYRNDFRAIILGRIESEAGGSRIRVFMRPSLLVLAFAAFALAFLLSLVAAGYWVLAWMGLASVSALSLACFWLDAVRASKLLDATFSTR